MGYVPTQCADLQINIIYEGKIQMFSGDNFLTPDNPVGVEFQRGENVCMEHASVDDL